MGYYFGVIVPRGQAHFALETPQLMDGYFRAVFLVEYPDTEFERLKSKTELDTYEMSEFMERCILFLSQEGVQVEPASKEWKLKRLT
jgi:hypothetical protein